MSPVKTNLDRILADLERRDHKLAAEVRATANKMNSHAEVANRFPELAGGFENPFVEGMSTDRLDFTIESIVKAQARPVLVIRDNQMVMQFLGPDSEIWKERLSSAKPKLNSIIPSIGRVELINYPGMPYAGTGWMVSEDILVTNRHVAQVFAQRDQKKYVFKTLNRGRLESKVDFLEEADRSSSLEFPVTEVLWISEEGAEIDVAFLRIGRVSGQQLPPMIQLADSTLKVDELVAAIGYPAKDSRARDQDLASRIFRDVYNKKRLAPGQITSISDRVIEHDCSTLGGNSGSALIDLATGRAVALHYAGEWLKANYAVPASIIKDRLARVTGGFVHNIDSPRPTPGPVGMVQTPPGGGSPSGAEQTFTLNIPVQVSVRVGMPAGGGYPSASIAGQPQYLNTEDAALREAQRMFATHPEVLGVRLSYSFREGWITDEKVILVELASERGTERVGLPQHIGGLRIETTAAPMQTLAAESVFATEGPFAERFSPGNYVPPRDIQLRQVDRDMRAIFHASPDSGFPVFKEFLAKTRRSITATMYEFEAPHVLDALLNAVKPGKRTLKMVTHYKEQAMTDNMDKLARVLGDRFEHRWASVGGGKLFASAYHIKVAVRDGEALWLSSGNWKDSNQPNIDPAGQQWTEWTPLLKHNREWHVVIENRELAQQFEAFINYDFEEADRVPKFEETLESMLEVFVPLEMLERRTGRPQYFTPLELDRRLKVRPLLTPDNYIEEVTKLVKSARRSIYFENQSLNPTFDRNGNQTDQPAFAELLDVLAKKQQQGLDVKIIVRDGREFPGGKEKVKEQLRRLKALGFDTRNIKVQRGCHTKGIIVDAEIAMLGSHNWTNEGTLSNRDASLIVYDAEVAQYYTELFEFDWNNLAKQDLNDEIEETRFAEPGEPTPQGMVRMKLSDLMS